MKNNKGFVFAETIIVLSILAVGLIMLYSTFSNILKKEKAQTTYNQTTDIYSLVMIKNYLQQIDIEFPNGSILPRGNAATSPNQVNTGSNSLYFRLECLCSKELNEATIRKYGYNYCKDTLNPLYSNYCSDLNNHLNVRDIYIIPNTSLNNKMNLAIKSIINHGNQIFDCGVPLINGGPCPITVSGKNFLVPRFLTSNIVGIPRIVNATLVDYLYTLSPIQSTVSGEVWSNDYIIIGEFFREGKFFYASIRYEG